MRHSVKVNNKKKFSRFSVFLLVLFVIAVILYDKKLSKSSVPQEEQVSEAIDPEVLVIPSGAEGQIISHTGYTLCYSEEHEQPYWVAYVLTPEEVNNKVVSREDNFREDPAIETGSASLKDYKKSGYDRGHLIPFADLAWSEEAASESFFLSNMSPQNASLNRGKWQELEQAVRDFTKDGPVCVVTGPVLSGGPYKTIGENEVSVPDYYYKVVLDYDGDEFKAIGFVLPNEKCTKKLTDYAVSVDEVERLTGLDFFFLLEDNLENLLESVYDISLWFSEI